MSGKLPTLTVAHMQRILQRAGWYVKRQGANHEIWTHPEKGGRVTVPRHPSQTLKRKTLVSILDQAEITAEELRKLR
jgi:mRNA interferase HicA